MSSAAHPFVFPQSNDAPHVGSHLEIQNLSENEVDALVANQGAGNEQAGVFEPAPSGSAEQSAGDQLPQELARKLSIGDSIQFAKKAAGKGMGVCKIAPLQEIYNMLQAFANVYIIEGEVMDEHQALQHRLEALLKAIDERSGGFPSPVMISKIEELRNFIERELNSLAGNQTNGQPGQLRLAKEDEDRFMVCYDLVQQRMEQILPHTRNSVLEMGKQQSQLHDRMFPLIGRIPSSPSAWYDSSAGEELKRRECTPGTRIQVLANLLGWACNDNKGGVYWLNGMAGTGKTTIAYSLCKELDIKRRLAASFFCSRLREECRNVNLIIPSVAYQLARFSVSFRFALSTILEKDPDIYTKRLHTQFQALIQEPLLATASEPPPAGGLVVVIDAIDECDNKESTRDILNLLINNATDLPIRFIVSSRPEPQIRDELTSERAKSQLVLHELDKGEVQADIVMYLREGLAPMNPSDEQVEQLAERAGILFIYAATAVRYIGYNRFRSEPENRLRDVLDGPQSSEEGGNHEIDELYTTILQAAIGNQNLRHAQRELMVRLLYTVICAREPVTVRGVSELLGIADVERVRDALAPLWSVLHVMEGSELVTTLHASFPDFMFEPKRSKWFHCDSNAHHCKIAEHCFKYIAKTQPQFNICRLDSSYLLDEDVPNIHKRVTECISSELLYACRYWVDHVHAANCASSIIEPMRDFLSTRLLLWMEVLNLTNHMKDGIKCAKLIVKWCKAVEGDPELAELAHDAQRFIETFALNPVSRSTPHIYVSMLAFWPRSAPLAKHYAKFTRGPVEAEGTALDRRQPAHLSAWAFGDYVHAIDVSPDGLYLAVVTGDDVQVVDSSSGKVVIGLLNGHLDLVQAVSFSYDGSRVLAGSFADDPDTHATIVSWDTRTGDTVLGPLLLDGHTDSINCLSISSDCSRIVTGSSDNTARLWDAETGQMLHRLEAQHSVNAAVFSPDGTQVATAACQTMHRWDTRTGQPTHAPLTHSYNIGTIAYFPDQSCIITGSPYSDDIHVWNALGGDVIRSLEGHTKSITCIEFSPDGRYIVSGSSDRTVRVWDAHTGNMVLGPLEGHTDRISSVAFSPDGSRIISACQGGLVCTWDARQRTLTSSSHTHLDRITCVKFSSDGSHFVSGSTKGTICIWDAHTGEIVLGPVEVHTSQIKAVDFKNNHVVMGFEDGKICVYNARSGEVVLGPLQVDSEAIEAVAYSPDSKLIATGSYGVLAVWDGQDGSQILGSLADLHDYILSVQFSPDGTRIVASSGGFSPKVVIWGVSSSSNEFSTLHGHLDLIGSVSQSPNGALIASGSYDDTVILWDACSGKKAIGPLTGHFDTVYSVSFSPDSTRLVSGSQDGTIRIWDVQTGETVFELLHGHEGWVESVEYSHDGTRILSRSGDGSVRIHDARSPEERARSRSESEVGDWTIDTDGWVVDDQSRPLVWVPGDLRKALISSQTYFTIEPQGYVGLKFDKSRMGESWARSYPCNM